MKRHDLGDISFLIPIRIDSESRLRNINLTIDYLLSNFQTKVLVIENDVVPKFKIKNRGGLEYQFLYDNKDYFHVTNARNILTTKASTPIVALWDADFIIPARYILNSVKLIRNDIYDVVYPFDGRMYDTDSIQIKLFSKSLDTDILEKYLNPQKLMFGNVSVGGGVFLNKTRYVNAGMENVNIKMWGADDSERYQRFKNLGLRISRSPSPAFHLNHDRLPACPDIGRFRNAIISSKIELLKISNMNKFDLENYIYKYLKINIK